MSRQRIHATQIYAALLMMWQEIQTQKSFPKEIVSKAIKTYNSLWDYLTELNKGLESEA